MKVYRNKKRLGLFILALSLLLSACGGTASKEKGGSQSSVAPSPSTALTTTAPTAPPVTLLTDWSVKGARDYFGIPEGAAVTWISMCLGENTKKSALEIKMANVDLTFVDALRKRISALGYVEEANDQNTGSDKFYRYKCASSEPLKFSFTAADAKLELNYDGDKFYPLPWLAEGAGELPKFPENWRIEAAGGNIDPQSSRFTRCFMTAKVGSVDEIKAYRQGLVDKWGPGLLDEVNGVGLDGSSYQKTLENGDKYSYEGILTQLIFSFVHESAQK